MKDEATIQFLTAGHVDDGKSTLIGRMLFDAGVIPEDQIAAATDTDGFVDYALFTDGLEDERRQGITIDVAYRFFRHGGRRFKLADTPGHLQYMRNMAVAAIASDVAVILVDAIAGVREQTVSYSKIARFFGIRQFVIAVNKMDAVEYSQSRFEEIQANYLAAFEDDDTQCDLHFVPVSALKGDNVAARSEAMPWYSGETVLDLLTRIERPAHRDDGLRLPIQHIVKDEGGVRWYLGTLHGEALSVGDTLRPVGSEQVVTVTGLHQSGRDVDIATRRDAVAVSIGEDVDISRGYVLVPREEGGANLCDEFYGDILWLDSAYEQAETFEGVMKIHHSETEVQITRHEPRGALVTAYVAMAHALPVDRYEQHPHTGLFLLIERYSERVVGVGTVSLPLKAGVAGQGGSRFAI